MKRTIIIVLTFLYFSTSGGMVLVSHYCMGELKESALFSDLSHACDDMPDDKESECCDTHSDELKHDDNLVISVYEIADVEVVLLYELEFFVVISESADNFKLGQSSHLPSLSVPDRLVRVQSFLL